MDEIVQTQSGYWIEKRMLQYLVTKVSYIATQEKMLYGDFGRSAGNITSETLDDILSLVEFVRAETVDGSVVTYVRFGNTLPQDFAEFCD